MIMEEGWNKDLIAYHRGELEGGDREAVEERLLSSQAFLMEFIALKRSREILAEWAEGPALPSERVRLKLKGEVTRLFPAGKAEKTRRLFWASLPASLGAAAALLAVIVTAGTYRFAVHGRKHAGAQAPMAAFDPKAPSNKGVSVDEANDVPKTLNIF